MWQNMLELLTSSIMKPIAHIWFNVKLFKIWRRQNYIHVVLWPCAKPGPGPEQEPGGWESCGNVYAHGQRFGGKQEVRQVTFRQVIYYQTPCQGTMSISLNLQRSSAPGHAPGPWHSPQVEKQCPDTELWLGGPSSMCKALKSWAWCQAGMETWQESLKAWLPGDQEEKGQSKERWLHKQRWQVWGHEAVGVAGPDQECLWDRPMLGRGNQQRG